MSYRIDAIDKQIVAQLQADGRAPCVEIARRIGHVTERVVRHRIKRMVNQGILVVSAVISPAAIGHPIRADVWVETEASATAEVAAALSRLDVVNYLAYSTGERNISLQVCAPDIPSLHYQVAELIGKLPGVRRTTVSVIPVVLKDIHQWNFPGAAVEK
jgi:DNA-binding Lrp family transcriptional regulator